MLGLDADILIVGSGFSGSLTALILDRIGLRPVLIDNAVHPRFAVGESVTPTADLVLGDLARKYDLPDLLPLTAYGTWREVLPEINRGPKRGFSYFQHRPGEAFVPNYQHSNELLVTASRDKAHADTHWFRANVDHFLSEQVRAAGIPFLDETHLKQFDNGPRWSVQGSRHEETVRITADFIIDASGPATQLKQALETGDCSGRFRTASRAILSHFRDVPRWSDWLARHDGRIADHPFPCDDAAVHHLLDGGWLWSLRFDDGTTSVGLVLDAARHRLDPTVSAEAEWMHWLGRYPSLAELFSGASLARVPGTLWRTGPLQRRVNHAVGPNWALLPHAAGFVDPLHSTGIAQSLCGIERLMCLFAAHWKQPEFELSLCEYEHSLFAEFDLIDDLVSGCYAALAVRHSETPSPEFAAGPQELPSPTTAGKDTSFRLFAAYSMLYFAAATTYERRRLCRTDNIPAAFLCVDDEKFRETVRGFASRMSHLRAAGWADEATVSDVEQTVRKGIALYNTAGLCDRAACNMYRYTAIPR